MAEFTRVRDVDPAATAGMDDRDSIPAEDDLAEEALYRELAARIAAIGGTGSKQSPAEAVKASMRQRSTVLQVAGALTPAPGDAAFVAATARALLAWLEAADSQDDLDARCQALWQQHLNEDLADGDTERFLTQAVKLHEFLTAPARKG